MTDQSAFSFRPLTAADGAAYGELLARSPDTGAIGAAVRFLIDPYTAMSSLHPDGLVMVIAAPGYEGLVGTGALRFGPRTWGGAAIPSALLHSLVTRPDFRQRGAASQLSIWLEAHARALHRGGGVTFALIQKGNLGSERTARSWCSQFLPDRILTIPIRPRTRAPTASAGIDIRELAPEEREEAAEGQNRFYASHVLYPPETGLSLARWCTDTPFETPFRRYLVASDRSGNLVAGLGLTETCRLRNLIVTRIARPLALANKLIQIVPSDGILRELHVSRAWYAPGQLAAARYLFETMRWQARTLGTSIMVVADRRSAALKVCGPRRWSLRSVAGVALRGPTPLSDDLPIYPT